MFISTAAIAAIGRRGLSGTWYADAGSAHVPAHSSAVHRSHGHIADSADRTSVRSSRARISVPQNRFSVMQSVAAAVFASFLFVMTVFTVGSGFFGYEMVQSFASNEEAEEFQEDYESDAEETFDDISAPLDDVDPDDESTWGALDSLRPTDDSSENSLGYLVHRLFVPGYMNNVEYAVAPWGDSGNDYQTDEDWLCEDPGSNPTQGTPLYHNCDIPNISSQLGQWGLSSIAKYGVQNAELSDPRAEFGVPSSRLFPDGEVPTEPSTATNKYTGLELYGYNLPYTTYVGEWDDIGVMTDARALQNFSGFDKLKLGATSVWNGIQGSLEGAAEGGGEAWSSAIEAGGVRYVTAPVEALWGATVGAVEGFSSGMIRTFLDTSDYNVDQTSSWYRRQYPSTLYGNVRQLTDQELAEIADRRQRFAMLDGYWNALEKFDVDGFEEVAAINPSASGSPLNDLPEFPTQEEIKAHEDKVDQWEDRTETWEEYDQDMQTYQNKMETYEPGGSIVPPQEPNSPSFSRPSDDPPEEPWEYIDIDEWIDEFDGYFGGADDVDLVNFNQCLNSDVHQGDAEGLRECWVNKYSGAMGIIVEDNLDLLQDNIVTEFFRSITGMSPDSADISGSDLPTNHPYNRYVCEDDNGDIYRNAEMTEVRTLYAGPNTSETNEEYGCPSAVRPPIQDGVFGNGYTSQWDAVDGNTPPGPDTRREEFNVYKALGVDFVYDMTNTASSFMLWVTVKITSFSNFLIDLSFNPPLEWLGFDEVVSELIVSFRDSMFFPLSVMVISVGAVSLMYTHVRRREYRQAFFSVAMIALIAISGTVIMDNPNRLVSLADEVPSVAENALSAAVFTSFSADGDGLCAPSGTPEVGEGEAYEDLDTFNGDAMGTSQVVRAMMCETWRNFAFTPWVHGQWGTSYENLDDDSMQNSDTNADLVGEAEVSMGGGAVEDNWALYQLDKMTSGTITTQDASQPVGGQDSEIYRIVDLQAGPDGGAGTDSRYFDRWSGNDIFGRGLDSFMSILASVMGTVAIFLYVLLKLEYTLFTTMLLIILPIMFLIGLEPNKGRSTLRKYFGSLVGAMAKRVFAVFFLSMMLAMMTHGTSAAPDSYVHVAVMLMLISLVFIMFRDKFMEMIEGVGNRVGGGSTLGQDGERMPGGGLFGKKFRKTVAEGAQGAAAGVLAGGAAGAIGGFSKKFQDKRESGEGFGSSVLSASRSGLKHTISEGYSGAKRASGIAYRREMQYMRSREGMGLFNKAWDLNRNLNEVHEQQMGSGRFDDASRRIAAKNIGSAIQNKEKDLTDIENEISRMEESGVDSQDSMMQNATQTRDSIRDELSQLRGEQDRALYSDDWSAKEMQSDLGSARVQRQLRHEEKRLSREQRHADSGKRETMSSDEYNEGIAHSAVLTDPDDEDSNYLQDSAVEHRRRSARHDEVMEERRRIIAEEEEQYGAYKEGALQESREEAWDHFANESGYEDAEDMFDDDPALFEKTKQKVDAVVEAKGREIDDLMNQEIESRLNEEQFKHSRYDEEIPFDTVATTRHALGDAKHRGFTVNMDEADRVIHLIDESTGAESIVSLVHDEDGNQRDAHVSMVDSDGVKTDLGTVPADGDLKEPMETAYEALGTQSEAKKRADTFQGSISEEESFKRHQDEFSRKRYRTDEIPRWAREEREKLQSEYDSADSIFEREGIEKKMREVDDIENRAADQQRKIEEAYHGGTEEESGVRTTNMGVGAREKSGRVVDSVRARAKEISPRKRKNRISRAAVRQDAQRYEKQKNNRKKVSEVRRTREFYENLKRDRDSRESQ